MDTSAHIARIGFYSNKIAEAMNMPTDFIDTITFAGPLHDIGKIGIPDSILRATFPPKDCKISIAFVVSPVPLYPTSKHVLTCADFNLR